MNSRLIGSQSYLILLTMLTARFLILFVVLVIDLIIVLVLFVVVAFSVIAGGLVST